MRGRTKSRATSNIRNRLEETAKIRRGKTMGALINKKADLIMNTLSNREPVKLL